jgi:hypothetical protein
LRAGNAGSSTGLHMILLLLMMVACGSRAGGGAFSRLMILILGVARKMLRCSTVVLYSILYGNMAQSPSPAGAGCKDVWCTVHVCVLLQKGAADLSRTPQ